MSAHGATMPLPRSALRNGVVAKRKGWKYLLAILLAPTLFSVLRKLAPGQPVVMDVLPAALVGLAAVWTLAQRRPLPRWAAVPLLIWAYFLFIYAGAAVSYNWVIGAAAVVTRILPIAMAWIAFATVRSFEDFRRVSRVVSSIAVVLLLPALVMAVAGNDVLPGVLSAIESSLEAGGATRSGVPAFSGFYSTFHVMGLTGLALFFLALSNAALAEVTKGQKRATWWAIAISAFLLVYLSTRRGALLAALIGIIGYMLTRRRVSMRLVFSGTMILVIALIIDQWGTIVGGRLEERSDLALALDLSDRLINVFGIVFWRWLSEAPLLGSFLGFAGPEGTALAGRNLYRRYVNYVEVGGAQLLAETGVIGALLMPTIVATLAGLAVFNARKLKCKYAVNLLVLYQLLFFGLYYTKELSAMGTPSTHLLLFWAVPGICAALIEREKSERKVRRWLHAERSRVQAVAHEPG